MLNLHNRLRSAQLFLARLSLQTHFLLIIISALFLALVIWVAFNSTTERMEEHIGARFSEKQVLYDKAHTLQPLIRKVALASQMANNAIIKQWAANEQNPQLHRQALAKIEILCQRFQCDSYFLALAQSGHYYSINFSGQYLDNTTQSKQMRYTLDTVKPADSWFYTAIKDRGDYLINVDSDVNLGVANIQINVPLRDGGKVLGVIGTTLKMTGQMFDAPQSGVSSIFMDRNAIVQILRDVNHINFPNFIKPSGRKYSIDYLLLSFP